MSKNIFISNLNELGFLSRKERGGFEKIFSRQFGIINALLKRNELKKYGLRMFQCLSAQVKVLFNLTKEVSSGGLGIDRSPKKAFLSCIGEALERYCMSVYKDRDLIFSSYNGLANEHLPQDFYLYTKKQYRSHSEFSDPKKAKIYWVKVSQYTNPKKFLYWPASLVYLPFEHGLRAAEATSTGVAAHTTLSNAVLGGTLEAIERDALMINFLQRLDPPELDTESTKGTLKTFILKIKRGYNLKIYKLYSDIKVPIFLGLIWRKNQNTLHYGIGACANLDSDKALEKTLKECLFTYFYSKFLMDLKQKNKSKIKTLYEHYLYYQDEDFQNLLFKKSRKEKYKKEKYSKNYLFEELRKGGLEVFFKELTTRDIKSTKIKVVRVIIPGLIDLNKSHDLRRKAATRFWTVPQKLNLPTKQNLWHMPHPFP